MRPGDRLLACDHGLAVTQPRNCRTPIKVSRWVVIRHPWVEVPRNQDYSPLDRNPKNNHRSHTKRPLLRSQCHPEMRQGSIASINLLKRTSVEVTVELSRQLCRGVLKGIRGLRCSSDAIVRKPVTTVGHQPGGGGHAIEQGDEPAVAVRITAPGDRGGALQTLEYVKERGEQRDGGARWMSR
jgi:hypothetical protein